jgi:erythromycin esterase
MRFAPFRITRSLMLAGLALLGGAVGAGGPRLAAAAELAPAAAAARVELAFSTAGERQSWYLGGAGYDVGFDARETRGESGQSLRLALAPGATPGPGAFAVATHSLAVAEARGKHLRLSGWIKTSAITRGWAGLWARVDGPQGSLGFDNMQDRGLHGTTPWTPVAVEMDVPPEATGVVLGALLTGDGAAWVSDLAVSLEPLRPAVPVVVAGRVEDPAGHPVGGALVALVGRRTGQATAVVKTGSDGTFRASVPMGRYALTATAAGFAAAFVPPAPGDSATPDGATLQLGSGGVELSGQIEVAGGRPAAGTRLTLARFSEEDGDLFYAETDGEGRFAVRLPPARYRIGLDSADYVAKPVEADLGPGAAARPVTLFASRLGAAPEEVVSWLSGHLSPLRTTRAGNGFDDLRPLAAVVGTARIVALGEATHGTREFFELKHRVLEYLVAELGFSVFAIEANWPESLAVDDYVLHGTGDPAKALAGIYFWTWNTEEVLDMIRWMRAYNADPAHPRKVRFLGFDMQIGRVASPVVAAYLAKVDPEYGKEMASALQVMRELKPRSPEAAAAKAAATALVARFDARKEDYVGRSNAEEWERMRQHAVILMQAAELAVQNAPGYRDRAMADNVGWLLAHEPPGTRMMLWAHNGHINYAAGPGSTPMGESLRQKFGPDYRSIGFLFDQGSFQAIDFTGKGRGLREFSLGPSPESHLAAAFHRTQVPLALLDLRSRPAGGPIAAWLSSPHPMRELGAVFSDEAGCTAPVVITDRFDALLFVDRTTRARPNPPIADAKGRE